MLAGNVKLPQLFSKEINISFSYLYILFVVAVIPSFFLEKSSLQSLRIALLWLFIKCFALITTFSIWWFGNSALLRFQKKITFRTVSALGAIGAGTASGLVTILAEYFSIPDEIPIEKRILGSFIIGGIWLPIYSYAITSFEAFRRIEEELLRNLDQQEEIRFKQSTFFYLMRTRAQEAIQERLRVTALESQLMLQDFVEKGENASRLPEVVLELATGSFRQISHDLIEESKSLRTSRSFLKSKSIRSRLSSWQNLVLLSYRTSFLSPIIFPAMTGIFTVGALLRHESVVGIFLVTANIWLLSFGILKIASVVIKKNEEKNHGLTNLLVIILLMVVPLLGVEILVNIDLVKIFDNGYRNFNGLYIIMVAVTTLALNLIQSSYLSSIELRNNLKNTLQSQGIEESVISNEITRVSEKWAKHIHGRLQSDLVIQAHRLQKAEEIGDSSGIESSIEHILRILRNPEHGLDLPGPSFQAELKKRKDLWSALINVVIESSLSGDQVRLVETIAVGECVEEMISNAARHGKANKIEIEISRRDSHTILVSAVDDGIGITSPKPGLGFHLFDHLSRGNWAAGKDEVIGKNSVKVFIDTSVLLDANQEDQIPWF